MAAKYTVYQPRRTQSELLLQWRSKFHIKEATELYIVHILVFVYQGMAMFLVPSLMLAAWDLGSDLYYVVSVTSRIREHVGDLRASDFLKVSAIYIGKYCPH
jgi:hypothetical protein